MRPEINKNITVISTPLDLGASKRGASLGPEAVKYAGLIQRLERIGYDVKEEDIAVNKKEAKTVEGSNLKNLNVVKDTCQKLCDKVDETMKSGRFPLVIGGDHSIAIGTIKGVLKNVKNLGVIWFDTHGDINTSETSPSGNIHGMPVASLLGLGSKELSEIGGSEFKVNKDNFVYVGCRDLDSGEREIIKNLGIHVFTMHEIDDIGIKEVVKKAIEIATNGTDGIHVSFDVDVLDPEIAPGTGTKINGGLSYREAHYALELVAKTEKVKSVEFVEVNPLIDRYNMTAEAAVALAGSLLGEWLI